MYLKKYMKNHGKRKKPVACEIWSFFSGLKITNDELRAKKILANQCLRIFD